MTRKKKTARGNVFSIVKAIYHDQDFRPSTRDVRDGEPLGLILDRTNFYAEQGGQESDTGKILIDGLAELDVRNVQIYAGYVLHTGYMKYGALSVGDEVISEYDEVRRDETVSIRPRKGLTRLTRA